MTMYIVYNSSCVKQIKMFLKYYKIHEFFPAYSISKIFPNLIYVLCVLMYTGQVCSLTGCGTVQITIRNEFNEYYVILIMTIILRSTRLYGNILSLKIK